MAMKHQTVEICIDELVLHGFLPRDRHQIGTAIEQELTRLFNERGLPFSFYHGRNTPLLNGGQFKMAKSEKGESIGSNIAGSVYSAFTGKSDKPV